MDPHREGRRSVSPHRAGNPQRHPTSAQGGPPSMNILSTILRAPHPSLQNMRGGQPDVRQPGRVQSPIRVITSLPTSSLHSHTVSPKAGGLSPSRIPTTLPPKKSLSPSRTIYVEARRTPSPGPKSHTTQGQVATGYTQGLQGGTTNPGGMLSQTQSVAQGKLLSHLPYLAQTLQQQQHQHEQPSHDRIFQQYKTVKAGDSLPVGKVVNTVVIRRSPSPSKPDLPRPAHQRTPTPPPTQVTTIRRTPSPAHMPMGTDFQGRGAGEHAPRTQAINLIKPHTFEQKVEIQADAEFRYGDLLQSINRSHEQCQSQLLQGGLSPITPAEPVVAKSWPPGQGGVVLPQGHQLISNPALAQARVATVSAKPVGSTGGIGVSVPVQYTSTFTACKSLTQAPTLSNALAGLGGGTQTSPRGVVKTVTSRPSHVQATSTRATVTTVSTANSFTPSTGFMPVVLPARSQTQRSRSPHQVQPTVPTAKPIAATVTRTYEQGLGSYSSKQLDASKREERDRGFGGNATREGISVTQPGPPNITISSCTTIPSQSQEKPVQKLPRNPFTFPATPPVSLTNERLSAAQTNPMAQSNLIANDGLTNQKRRHESGDMPHLSPVPKVKKIEIKEEDVNAELVSLPNALNMRMATLSNFPNNPHNRPTYRATSVAIHKAKVGCITNPAKSLDILRQNLQKVMNKEIDVIIQKYMDQYFKLGIENIKLNNGDNAVTEDHLQAVRRQILEEAKKMYVTDICRTSVSPARDMSGNVSETGSSGRRSALGRRRHPSDSDSEHNQKAAVSKRKKGRSYIVNLTGRSTPSKLAQQHSKREGPKFEPERLTDETMWVMGSKANKAMGFGATRGRLYMKHPDLFKYSGDQDDKTWLYEHQHMPATGGKSYLIILDDVRELAMNDEYKDIPGMTVETLGGFTVPMWMIEKMRIQMVAMRTDLPKQAKYRSRSATPNVTEEVVTEGEHQSPPKDLPFASFSSPVKPTNLMEASPADEELDFLAGTSDNRDTPSQLSPFQMTGGFDDTASQSDLDNLDDDPTFTIK